QFGVTLAQCCAFPSTSHFLGSSSVVSYLLRINYTVSTFSFINYTLTDRSFTCSDFAGLLRQYRMLRWYQDHEKEDRRRYTALCALLSSLKCADVKFMKRRPVVMKRQSHAEALSTENIDNDSECARFSPTRRTMVCEIAAAVFCLIER
ncbi:hypothetical protein Tcan_11165, partial [Toxocara canis]